jgi:hypothetical protein
MTTTTANTTTANTTTASRHQFGRINGADDACVDTHCAQRFERSRFDPTSPVAPARQVEGEGEGAERRLARGAWCRVLRGGALEQQVRACSMRQLLKLCGLMCGSRRRRQRRHVRLVAVWLVVVILGHSSDELPAGLGQAVEQRGAIVRTRQDQRVWRGEGRRVGDDEKVTDATCR